MRILLGYPTLIFVCLKYAPRTGSNACSSARWYYPTAKHLNALELILRRLKGICSIAGSTGVSGFNCTIPNEQRPKLGYPYLRYGNIPLFDGSVRLALPETRKPIEQQGKDSLTLPASQRCLVRITLPDNQLGKDSLTLPNQRQGKVSLTLPTA